MTDEQPKKTFVVALLEPCPICGADPNFTIYDDATPPSVFCDTIHFGFDDPPLNAQGCPMSAQGFENWNALCEKAAARHAIDTAAGTTKGGPDDG